MRHTLLSVLLIMAVVSPAAARSCATLGRQLDCRGAPAKQPANSTQPSRTDQKVKTQGYAETTVSNRGASTDLNNRVIDSHGVFEFGFSGSRMAPCRTPGYGALCY